MEEVSTGKEVGAKGLPMCNACKKEPRSTLTGLSGKGKVSDTLAEGLAVDPPCLQNLLVWVGETALS